MRFHVLSASLILLLASAFGARAAQPRLHQTIRDWAVFTMPADGDLMCYVRSYARDKSPKNVDHGDVIFFVTSWKSGSAVHQPSLMTGYTIKSVPPPRVRIGSTRITMYADGKEAFIEDERDERKLVNAMRKGASMRIEARSARGTATAYEFSLAGITAALKKADALCK